MNWWFKMVGGKKRKKGLEINGLWVVIALEKELVMGHQPSPQRQSSGRLQIPHGSFLQLFGNAVCIQLTGYLQLHYGFPYLCGPCMPLKNTVFPKNFRNISSVLFPHSRKTDLSVASLYIHSLTKVSKWGEFKATGEYCFVRKHFLPQIRSQTVVAHSFKQGTKLRSFS